MAIKTYSELILLNSFEERFKYLKLHGSVGYDTFGFDRYMNQNFYKSTEWKRIRYLVITRDNGNDLAFPDHQIIGNIIIHHMNPINQDDISESSEFLLNPEYLVCVSRQTHNLLHYGEEEFKDQNIIVIRSKNDTTPWNK